MTWAGEAFGTACSTYLSRSLALWHFTAWRRTCLPSMLERQVAGRSDHT